MIKKILKVLFLIVAFLNIKVINAENIEYPISKRRYANTYAVYDGPDRVHLFYAQSYVISDVGQAYCIEPGVGVDTDYYYATTDLSISGLSEEVLKKIRLIAYYGFNYARHTSNKYYMAAQELIWREITGREIYWVSEEDINGSRIDIENQKNEIKSLVANHYTLPSFDNEEIVLEAGKTYVINDTNNVLSHFKIYDSPIDNLTIEDNKITIQASSKTESGEVKLVDNQYTDKVTLIYYQGNNQKLMSSTGMLEPITSSFKVKVINKPYITVKKVDKKNHKDIYLEGIKFKIKNSDTSEYICENDDCIYETNENGTFTTKNKFDYGNYELEEVDGMIDGYMWNQDVLEFTIDENSDYQEENGNLYFVLQFENEPVNGSLEVIKMGEEVEFKNNLIEYIPNYLDNVVFNLYANADIYNGSKEIIYHKNELIGAYITSHGKINIDNLPLGSYYIKEVSTIGNHVLDKENHYFNLEYKDQYTANVRETITLKNYLAKGILEFVKIDSVSGEPLANTQIAIYTSNNELVFTGYTNDEGKIIIEGLPLGEYYIKELNAPEGYTINNDNIYFKIKTNNEIVSTVMENTTIDAPSTNLNKNYYIYIVSIIFLIIGLCLYKYEKE